MVRAIACGLVLCGVAAALGQPGRGPAMDTMESTRVAVHATPEEWWVILPVLQRVITARQAISVLQSGGVGAGGEPGRGPRGVVATQPATMADDAAANERKLDSAQALKQAQMDLDAGQAELRLLLSAEQQDTLVKMGYLVK